MGAGDVFSGLGHGMLSLLGAGDAYNPMGKLSGELSQAIQDMNNMVANESLLAVQTLSKDVTDMYKVMNQEFGIMDDANKLMQTQLWNAQEVDNIFLTVLSVVIIIIVFYLLFQKRCC